MYTTYKNALHWHWWWANVQSDNELVWPHVDVSKCQDESAPWHSTALPPVSTYLGWPCTTGTYTCIPVNLTFWSNWCAGKLYTILFGIWDFTSYPAQIALPSIVMQILNQINFMMNLYPTGCGSYYFSDDFASSFYDFHEFAKSRRWVIGKLCL